VNHHATASDMATDFRPDIEPETAANLIEQAGSPDMAMCLQGVMGVLGANRTAMVRMLRTQPEAFSLFDQAVTTYLKHVATLHELAELAQARIVTARAYAESHPVPTAGANDQPGKYHG
jgi:hypothetical protein